MPVATVNGSIDAAAAVAGDSVDADDDRWEQVRSRNRTVFNNTVRILLVIVEHLSCDACLEDNWEDYQNSSVLYSVCRCA